MGPAAGPSGPVAVGPAGVRPDHAAARPDLALAGPGQRGRDRRDAPARRGPRLHGRRAVVTATRAGPPGSIHRPRAEWACTMSTRAMTWSTGVWGRMPCPRLKMWPGR